MSDRPTRPVRVYDEEHYASYMVGETAAYMDYLEEKVARLQKANRGNFSKAIDAIAGEAKARAENKRLKHERWMLAANIQARRDDTWDDLNTWEAVEASEVIADTVLEEGQL